MYSIDDIFMAFCERYYDSLFWILAGVKGVLRIEDNNEKTDVWIDILSHILLRMLILYVIFNVCKWAHHRCEVRVLGTCKLWVPIVLCHNHVSHQVVAFLGSIHPKARCKWHYGVSLNVILGFVPSTLIHARPKKIQRAYFTILNIYQKTKECLDPADPLKKLARFVDFKLFWFVALFLFAF